MTSETVHRFEDFFRVMFLDDEGHFHNVNDQPAIIWKNAHGKDKDYFLTHGTRYWYKHGLLHRDNNLPAIDIKDGGKHYYINGKCIEFNSNIHEIPWRDPFKLIAKVNYNDE